jgi:hypothetical protein
VLEGRHKALIRALIYPIQFENDPVDGVDKVLERVVGAGALGATPHQYAHAIQTALQSDEPLGLLIPQPHPEPAIRIYLAAIRKRLVNRE